MQESMQKIQRLSEHFSQAIYTSLDSNLKLSIWSLQFEASKHQMPQVTEADVGAEILSDDYLTALLKESQDRMWNRKDIRSLMSGQRETEQTRPVVHYGAKGFTMQWALETKNAKNQQLSLLEITGFRNCKTMFRNSCWFSGQQTSLCLSLAGPLE